MVITKREDVTKQGSVNTLKKTSFSEKSLISTCSFFFGGGGKEKGGEVGGGKGKGVG